MSRVLTIGVIALAMATAGWGTTLCATGSLADYLALGSAGCQIDDKVFSNFTASLGNPTGVTIKVTPDPTPGNPGLQFQLTGFTVTGGAANDLILGFTVVDLSGPNITDASLGMVDTSTGGSEVTIGEKLCVGGTFSGAICSTGGTPPQEVSLTVTDPPPSFSDETPLGPTGTVGVLKDISITSGTDGVASLSLFSQNFSEVVVPEPASIVLLGSALLGLGLLRRRLT